MPCGRCGWCAGRRRPAPAGRSSGWTGGSDANVERKLADLCQPVVGPGRRVRLRQRAPGVLPRLRRQRPGPTGGGRLLAPGRISEQARGPSGPGRAADHRRRVGVRLPEAARPVRETCEALQVEGRVIVGHRFCRWCRHKYAAGARTQLRMQGRGPPRCRSMVGISGRGNPAPTTTERSHTPGTARAWPGGRSHIAHRSVPRFGDRWNERRCRETQIAPTHIKATTGAAGTPNSVSCKALCRRFESKSESPRRQRNPGNDRRGSRPPPVRTMAVTAGKPSSGRVRDRRV